MHQSVRISISFGVYENNAHENAPSINIKWPIKCQVKWLHMPESLAQSKLRYELKSFGMHDIAKSHVLAMLTSYLLRILFP